MHRDGQSKLAESARLPTSISQESGSNFGHYADYSEVFRGYPPSLHVKGRVVPLKSRHFNSASFLIQGPHTALRFRYILVKLKY
jgi:hypothetical protein